jgi:hypothetical protein
MMHITGRTIDRITVKGAEYVEFTPPRRPEQYVGQPGPHNGLALTHDVLTAIAQSRITGQRHPFLVRGEWIRKDGKRFLDIAIDRAWVTENTHYRLIEGRLRWVCPVCGKLSGQHTKACDYE